MQKQVNFFERHVQWFAVGLGGLFLLFMVFKYVLSSPITVPVAGKELGPGEVDEVTLAGPVEELKRAIANPQVPKIDQPDYVPQFLAAIHGTNQEFPVLASTWTSSRPMGGKAVDGPDPKAGPVIVQLPKLPAASPAKSKTGRTTVMWPDPDWNAEEARANEEQPMLEADKDWFSAAWVIKGEALTKAFEAAFPAEKIRAAKYDPDRFMQTAFLDVQLVRREVLGGGKFGKEEVVKPLPISGRNAMPFPGEVADPDKLPDAERKKRDEQVIIYISWAAANPQELLAPAFYDHKAGEPWESPVEVVKAEAPVDMKEVRKKRLAAEEAKKQKELAARKQKQAQERAQRGQRRGAGGGGGAGGGPGGGAMPNAMPQGPMGGAGGGGPGMAMPPGMGGGGGMAMPPGMGGGGGMAMPPGMGGGGGMAMPPGMGGGARGGGMNPGGGNVGPGQFNVADAEDVQVVAHDDTVQPGKTYQYKLRYRLWNPTYKQGRIIKPELAKQFSITAPDSAWTKPVTIRAQVEFFLAEVNPREGKGRFDVFEWREGRMQKSSVQAGPGDAIGKTGWSVVDIRGTGRGVYGLLMDGAGAISRHNPEVSDRHQQLLDEVEGGGSEAAAAR